MDQYKLKAKSSSGGYYEVTLTTSDSATTIFCSCEAGIHGKLCKHKTGILDDDRSLLFDPDEKDIMEKIKSVISKTNYGDLRKAHLQIKADIEDLQKKERKARTTLEEAMRIGINLR